MAAALPLHRLLQSCLAMEGEVVGGEGRRQVDLAKEAVAAEAEARLRAGQALEAEEEAEEEERPLTGRASEAAEEVVEVGEHQCQLRERWHR